MVNKAYKIRYLNKKGKNPATRKNLDMIIKQFYKVYTKNLLEFDLNDLDNWNTVLDNNKKLSLETKKLRFQIIKQFVIFTMKRNRKQLSDPFTLVDIIEEKANWYKPNANEKRKQIFYEIPELKKILTLVSKDYTKYMIFLIYMHTGMRRNEVVDMDLDFNLTVNGKTYTCIEETLKDRMIYTIGKNTKGEGKKELIYYIPEKLRDLLLRWIPSQRDRDFTSNAVFVSIKKRRFAGNSLYDYHKRIIDLIGLEGNIHSFRKSINNAREENGCPDKYLNILLNQIVPGVNFKSYVKKNREKFLGYYDKYDTYGDVY